MLGYSPPLAPDPPVNVEKILAVPKTPNLLLLETTAQDVIARSYCLFYMLYSVENMLATAADLLRTSPVESRVCCHYTTLRPYEMLDRIREIFR